MYCGLPRPVIRMDRVRFRGFIALLSAKMFCRPTTASRLWPEATGMRSALLTASHEIPLSDRQAVVPQNSVRGGDMKEELRQAVMRKIPLALHFLFLWRAGTQHDVLRFAPLKSRRRDAI